MPPSSGFTGLTAPNQHTSGGGRSPEAAGGPSPPWDEDLFDAPREAFPTWTDPDANDIAPQSGGRSPDASASARSPLYPWTASHYEAPGEAYSSFMIAHNGGSSSSDPLLTNDPWLQASGLHVPKASGWQMPPVLANPFASTFAPTASSPFVVRPPPGMQAPAGSPQSSGAPSATGTAPQVDPDDELSESHTPEVPQQVRGYTTPVPQGTQAHVGMFVPLYRRQGTSPISEQQVRRVLHGHQLTLPTRSTEAPRRQHLVRHNFPISAGHSRSFRQSPDVTREAPPSQHRTSLDRVLQTVSVINQYRESRRDQSRAAGSTVPVPGETSQASRTAEAATPAAAASPPDLLGASPEVTPIVHAAHVPVPTSHSDHDGISLPPAVYDGADEECSICQASFEQGERVCRLSCRHVFHTECWGRFMSTPPSVDAANTPRSCPNCRVEAK